MHPAEREVVWRTAGAHKGLEQQIHETTPVRADEPASQGIDSVQPTYQQICGFLLSDHGISFNIRNPTLGQLLQLFCLKCIFRVRPTGKH